MLVFRGVLLANGLQFLVVGRLRIFFISVASAVNVKSHRSIILFGRVCVQVTFNYFDAINFVPIEQ